MTTRRRRNSGSNNNDNPQLPGTKAWRDRVQKLQQDLDAHGGRQRQTLEREDAAKASEKQEIIARAETLQIPALLGYLNETVLNGEGVIETGFYWESEEDWDEDDEDWDEDEDDDDEEDEDEDEDEDWDDDELDDEFSGVGVLVTTLSWKAAARVCVKVELAREEDGFLLRMSDDEWPATARNVQIRIFNAFKKELALEAGEAPEGEPRLL